MAVTLMAPLFPLLQIGFVFKVDKLKGYKPEHVIKLFFIIESLQPVILF